MVLLSGKEWTCSSKEAKSSGGRLSDSKERDPRAALTLIDRAAAVAYGDEGEDGALKVICPSSLNGAAFELPASPIARTRLRLSSEDAAEAVLIVAMSCPVLLPVVLCARCCSWIAVKESRGAPGLISERPFETLQKNTHSKW